jgi:hypothetical protein
VTAAAVLLALLPSVVNAEARLALNLPRTNGDQADSLARPTVATVGEVTESATLLPFGSVCYSAPERSAKPLLSGSNPLATSTPSLPDTLEA